MEALVAARGGSILTRTVPDPLGRPVAASFAILADGLTAVVEVAQASGLWRLKPEERDPLETTTRGTGELVMAAIEEGAETVLVACGGSATVDGGAGALEAIDPAAARLVVLCDTTTPWERCAAVFGPQKGAGEAEVAELEGRLERLAAEFPRDPRGVEMGGAAGGLSGGLWAHGAELVRGAAHVLAAVRYDERMRAADLVITGEGRVDESTLTGKAVFEVATRARQAGVPCHAIAGENALDDFSFRLLGLDSIQEAGTPEQIAAATTRLREGFGAS